MATAAVVMPSNGTPTPTSNVPSTSALPPFDTRQLAVVDDLQLSPALCLPPDATVERGIGEALMRDFSILPIVEKRRPVGYLNVPEMQQAMAEGRVEGGEAISNAMRVFERSRPYTEPSKRTVITPDTPLSTLERFFETESFCIVTDAERKFVLAVCTREDLAKFLERWSPRAGSRS